jgi:hypothetical protein
MTTPAELGHSALTVSPGGAATTTLTIRNETDIVEAYVLSVVGDGAPWTTVEPARVSLYPGTSETVTVRLAPTRSPEVRAGDFPLGIKVLPVERPELVAVPEAVVTVLPFQELRAALAPRRRRGWLRARYRLSVRNLGNAVGTAVFAPGQAGEELRLAVAPERLRLEPGESAETRLRVRTRRLIWFGKPVTRAFEVAVSQDGAAEDPQQGDQRHTLDGEFVQLAIFPRWLLALLAALLALLLLWFALVRPAVQSSAKQAAKQAVAQAVATSAPPTPGAGASPGTGGQSHPGGGQSSPAGGGGSSAAPGQAVPGSGAQSSGTVDVQTGTGATKVGSYQVPHGKVFSITDIVAANFQGDQGLLTIKFGNQTITTIALETFRNQDYHWVTPIVVPEDQTVTATVTCQLPGTPASGKQASQCHELLNVSGEMSDIQR